MAKKEVKVQEKPDCRRCKRASPESDFMCFCSVLNVYRSVGIRVCNYYVMR